MSDMKFNITTTARPMEDKMALLDWNGYRKQILARVGEISKLSPDTVNGYAALGGAGTKTGHLDAKTRRTPRCPPAPGPHNDQPGRTAFRALPSVRSLRRRLQS